MKVSTKIGIVAIGDPEDRATWSGTPKALVESLREAGLTVIGFNADRKFVGDKLIYGILGRAVLGRGVRGFRQYYGPRSWPLRNGVSNFRR